MFVNKTFYKEQEHKELSKVIFLLNVVPILLLYLLFCIIFVILGLVIKNYLLFGAFLTMMIVFPVFMAIVFNVVSKNNYKKASEVYRQSFYKYTFKDNGVELEFTYRDNKSKSFYEYSKMRVVETKKSIILMISFKTVFIVRKAGFEKNYDQLGFRSVVQGKVKKYIFMR